MAHDDPDLPLRSGVRIRLRSDLPPQEAEACLSRLEVIEGAIDSAFPWLEEPPGPRTTLVLADPARYALHASDHEADPASDAFVCAEGEVVARHRPSVVDDRPPFPTEPSVRPLAAALLRRRLLARYGADLPPTWIEEGLAQVTVDLAASALGEEGPLRRRTLERLVDATLPLYLGGRPALARLLAARGRAEMRRAGNAALAWGAVRFLLADAQRSRLVSAALAEAGGLPSAEEDWEEALAEARRQESAFEAFLLGALLEELLATYEEAPRPVDRWEAAACLRLVANIDLDAEADDETRARLVEGARRILREHPPAPRFLDRYVAELDRLGATRSRLAAMRRLQRAVRHELLRRSQGYGHPAIERALRDLPRALQRALRRQERSGERR
ncbi:MAG: hypothetical protein D6731_14695 [Planctomycetota bacterium]|nr:MAG: hypothetical protein D6731_14695 [Planctomycetota bacterium]